MLFDRILEVSGGDFSSVEWYQWQLWESEFGISEWAAEWVERCLGSYRLTLQVWYCSIFGKEGVVETRVLKGSLSRHVNKWGKAGAPGIYYWLQSLCVPSGGVCWEGTGHILQIRPPALPVAIDDISRVSPGWEWFLDLVSKDMFFPLFSTSVS